MERPVPFPGWTLPGVMGAGGADILLRSGGSLTADKDAPVVLAGNGPLLLLLAGHLLDAGVRIAAWLDTGSLSQRLLSGAAMPAALLDPPYLGKGLRMALRVLRGGVPVIRNARDIRALGADRLEKVSYAAKGETRELPAAVLLRHEGIIPRVQICNALGARLRWDRLQRCWYRTWTPTVAPAWTACMWRATAPMCTAATPAASGWPGPAWYRGPASGRHLPGRGPDARGRGPAQTGRAARAARDFLRYVAPDENFRRVRTKPWSAAAGVRRRGRHPQAVAEEGFLGQLEKSNA